MPQTLTTYAELKAHVSNLLSLHVRLFKKNPSTSAWRNLEDAMLAYQQVERADSPSERAALLAEWSRDPREPKLAAFARFLRDR